MKYTNTLTAALVALFLTLATSAAAQTEATAQATPDTRTTTEREQDEAAERWRVQERARLKKEKEAKDSGATSGTPAITPTPEESLDEFRRRMKKEAEQVTRDALKPLPTIKVPPPVYNNSRPNTPNLLDDYNERQRVEAERAQQAYLTKQQEQSARESAFAQRAFPIGLILAISFVGLIALSMWRFPKSRSMRFHIRNLVVGVVGLISGVALVNYVGGVDVESGGLRFIALLSALATFVFAAFIFAGVVGLLVSLCTLAESKGVRLATVLAVSFVGLAGSLYISMWPGNLRLPSLIGGLGFAAFALVLIIGLFKVRSGSRGQAVAGSGEDEYHGSARFATDEEIKELTIKRGHVIEPGSFILAPPMPERGIKGQIVLPRMQTTQHGLILGGTGTGKSRGYFLPNCAQAVDTSLVVTDPKSELWKLTSGFRERALRYAPADPDASAGFNWIQLCNDARMAELCARAIIASGNTSHTDQFFIDTESAFLAALFAHAATLPEATPLTAYGLFTKQAQEDLMKQLLESPSEVARDQAVIFMQTDSRYRGAIVPAVSGRLQFMRDKAVRRFTSATLDAPDFGRLRQEPTALYWCLREQDIVRLRPLTSLFFTVLLEQIAGAPEGAAGIPVTMMLDEFANIGTIPDFETTISLARGRGVALWLGVQSLSQLDKSYGRENAQTIITNCSTKIALHGLDYNTAKYVSDMLGESTIVAKRHSFSFSPTGLVSVGRHGTEHRKMLLTPDEVMRLSETEAIIRTGNKYPMKLRKGYYDEPARTAPTSALGEAITKDFPPLVLAGSAATTGERMDTTGNAKQTETTLDIL